MIVMALLAMQAADALPAFPGPGRICMRETSFDLREGESAKMTQGGMHGASFDISTSGGTIAYTENEIFSQPEGGAPVTLASGVQVARYRVKGRPRYLYVARTSFSGDGVRPIAWISGSALKGDRRDLAILERVRTGPVDFGSCTRRYVYGVVE